MSQITTETYFNRLLSEICIEISFKVFQNQMKINSLCPHCNQNCGIINEKAGLDIYGNRIDNNGGIASSSNTNNILSAINSNTDLMNTGTCTSSGMLTVECPCCKKVLAATRFAPHLEKCMGMGRQSARKRGNFMIKVGNDVNHVGSDNDSNEEAVDYSGNFIRTPAQSVTEDSFSPVSTSNATNNSQKGDPKKPKISPSKIKSSASSNGNNSKATSPSKVKRTTPLKGKSINTKK